MERCVSMVIINALQLAEKTVNHSQTTLGAGRALEGSSPNLSMCNSATMPFFWSTVFQSYDRTHSCCLQLPSLQPYHLIFGSRKWTHQHVYVSWHSTPNVGRTLDEEYPRIAQIWCFDWKAGYKRTELHRRTRDWSVTPYWGECLWSKTASSTFLMLQPF